jgi:hypothetical protein
LSGTYTVDASGRVLVTKTGKTHPAVAIYLASSNTGFIASAGGTDVSFGFVEPQTSGSFSAASLSGPFSFGSTDQTEENVTDISGVANFDGIGSVAGTNDLAALGSTPVTATFSNSYSVTNGTGTPGRGTITQSGGTLDIFYIISPSKVVVFEFDDTKGGGANANPALIIGEK